MSTQDPHTIYGLFGAGGHGREMIPILQRLANRSLDESRVVFVDDKLRSELVSGIMVCSYSEFMNMEFENKFFNVAISNSRVRERVSREAIADGLIPVDIRDESALVYDSAVLEAGAMLSPFVMISCDVTIGKYFQANAYCQVSHDCVIGDYVTFAPGVRCNGNVHIGDHTYVGSGAIIKNGTPARPLRIGAGAVIGMGAVVLNDVASGTTVVGNPAREISRK